MTANFTRNAKLAEDLNWMDRAACKGEDVDTFFPTATKGPGQEERAAVEAKVICKGCDVRTDCLAYALTFSASQLGLYGVYGGTTRKERYALLKKRRPRS